MNKILGKKKTDDRKQLLIRYRLDENDKVSFTHPCCEDIPARLFFKVMEALSIVEREWNLVQTKQLEETPYKEGGYIKTELINPMIVLNDLPLRKMIASGIFHIDPNTRKFFVLKKDYDEFMEMENNKKASLDSGMEQHSCETIKYQYKCIRRDLNDLMGDVSMSDLGHDGWELASFQLGHRYAAYIFKREVTETSL
jgi:hypothetical protein